MHSIFEYSPQNQEIETIQLIRDENNSISDHNIDLIQSFFSSSTNNEFLAAPSSHDSSSSLVENLSKQPSSQQGHRNRNENDVIEEFRNVFLEKYLEKNKVGRKSKFSHIAKNKFNYLSSSSASSSANTSNSLSNERTRLNSPKSYEMDSLLYSSYLKNFHHQHHETTTVDFLPVKIPVPRTNDFTTVKNICNQQHYSLNLNSVNYYPEEATTYSSSYAKTSSDIQHANSSLKEYTEYWSLEASSFSDYQQHRNYYDNYNHYNQRHIPSSISNESYGSNNPLYHYLVSRPGESSSLSPSMDTVNGHRQWTPSMTGY